MKKKKIIIGLGVLSLLAFTLIGLTMKKNTIQVGSKTTLEHSVIADLTKDFTTNEDFGHYNADLTVKGDQIAMSSKDDGTSEAWTSYKSNLSSTKDFVISAEIHVPKEWDSKDKKEAQVGIGLFVGKEGTNGTLVYESDLCTIANTERFVQGQMIKNRKGGEPNNVEMITTTEEKGTMEIRYSSKDKTLSLYFNDKLVGTEKIDQNGSVNWNMSDSDKFIVGIIGFSEHTAITENYPTLSNFKISTN